MLGSGSPSFIDTVSSCPFSVRMYSKDALNFTSPEEPPEAPLSVSSDEAPGFRIYGRTTSVIGSDTLVSSFAGSSASTATGIMLKTMITDRSHANSLMQRFLLMLIFLSVGGYSWGYASGTRSRMHGVMECLFYLVVLFTLSVRVITTR